MTSKKNATYSNKDISTDNKNTTHVHDILHEGVLCDEQLCEQEHDKIKHYRQNHSARNSCFTYDPLHQFCVSLLIIENKDIKYNILQKYPHLRFHVDTTEQDRMDLLTPDVLQSITAPIAYVYKKNKRNAYIFDGLEDFLSEVLTNDEHGIFYIIHTGIRIRRIEIDIEKIIGYVYIVIKNVALKIATRNTQNIDVQLTLDNTHYIQSQLSDPENYRLIQNSMYNITPDSLDIVEHSLDKDYQDIQLQKLHSYRILQSKIDFTTDMYVILGTLFYQLIQSQVEQLKSRVADSFLLTTQNKFIPYLLLNHPTLVTRVLLQNHQISQRHVTELYNLWLSTTEQRNKIISNDCNTQKEYRKYLTWLCNGNSDSFGKNTQISSKKQDTFGKNAIRSHGDLCAGTLMSLVLGITIPHIYQSSFDYPTEYKLSLFKALTSSKNSLQSLKYLTNEAFLLRVKSIHKLLRKNSYFNALCTMESIIFNVSKNQTFEERFIQCKKDLRNLRRHNDDVSKLVMELTRTFYAKDEEQYNEFPMKRNSNLETRFGPNIGAA